MDDKPNVDIFFAKLGTATPCWRLSGDSNLLHLASDVAVTFIGVAILLTPEQIAQIQQLTEVAAQVQLDVDLFGQPIHLYLAGRKLDDSIWTGTASCASDEMAVARDLVQSLSFAEHVVSEVNAVILIADWRGRICRFNRLAEEVTGLQEADVVGKEMNVIFGQSDVEATSGNNVMALLNQTEPQDFERAIQTMNGERLFLFRNRLLHRGHRTDERFLICCGTEVTEERFAERRLLELANTDPLTGLPNRNSIHDRISTSIASRVEPGTVGILFLDIDNFKKINDHYGHAFGDRLLTDLAARIGCCLSKADTLGRVSGDEFVVLVPQATGDILEAIAHRILERMRVPFSVGSVEVYSSCSIGIALSPEHGNDVETLIRSADTAMYVAKDEGKHTYRMFASGMDHKVAEYIWLDRNLRHGLSAGELRLYYQPKLELSTGAVHSVEALIRWESPQRGLVMPGEFIGYAEESGLIDSLGRWVMKTAAEQAARWKMRGLDLRIAINVSVRQLADSNVVDYFREALIGAGFESSPLDIELTETCLIQNEQVAVELISQFKALGAEVHLDDFGTGYSSLAQLGRIPLDMIKLDPTFVRSTQDDRRSQALMRSIIAVAQELRLKVVVEGVETEAEEVFMKTLGVDYVQGYRYARPMPVMEFEQWLANRQEIGMIA